MRRGLGEKHSPNDLKSRMMIIHHVQHISFVLSVFRPAIPFRPRHSTLREREENRKKYAGPIPRRPQHNSYLFKSSQFMLHFEA
uniref:Uncharacterized protein n=1 Tax=Anopheles darlingi TaxID=43151 RepID=A0A2M4CXD5_ANODA